MKSLRTLGLLLGALLGAACFAAESNKADMTSPAPTAIPNDLPKDPADLRLAGHHRSAHVEFLRTRENKHSVEWETYTPRKDDLRLPAWFKCTVTLQGSSGEFTLYEVGAQGRKYPVIIQFEDPSKVTSVTTSAGTTPPADLTKPFEVNPMAKWNEFTQTGSDTYRVTVSSNKCTFYAVYKEYPVLTAMPKQPGDGSPPPPNSGNEH